MTRVCSGWWLILALALIADARAAAEEPRERWTPSMWLSTQARFQPAKGSVESTLLLDSRPVLFSDEVDIFGVSIPVGLGAEAPSVGWLPGQPRPFLEASYQLVPGSDRIFLDEGTAGNGMTFETKIENQWQASLGLAFALDAGDRPIQFRPSVGYFGQQLDFKMNLTGVVPGTSSFLTLAPTGSEVFHYLGPRVAIEVDAGHRGAFRFSVFADFAGYLLLSDGTMGSTTSGSQSASFRYDPDEFTIQGGLGVRVSWDPSE